MQRRVVFVGCSHEGSLSFTKVAPRRLHNTVNVLEALRSQPVWRPTRPWKEWQAERDALLSRFINEQVYPYSAFYRRVFDEHRIDPRKIRSVDDLRRLPFTAKADIVPTPENPTRALDLVLRPDKEAIAAGSRCPRRSG